MARYKSQLYIVLLIITIFIGVFLSSKISFASDFFGSLVETTSHPSSIASEYVFTNNNNIYSIGGANNSTINSANFASINLDGTLNTWQNLLAKPNRLWHAGSNYNNYVYVLGGGNSSSINTDSVIFGEINPSGDISSWTETTPLPQPLSLGASVIYNNIIYFAGGSTNQENGASAISEIYKANINSDGTLGNWTVAGHLPEPLLGFNMIENNGYLIITGGKNIHNEIISNVSKAQIDFTTGNIGLWTPLTPLPKAIYRSAISKINNIIVVTGGYFTSPSFTLVDNIYYSDFDPSTNTLTWTDNLNKLPIALCCHSQTIRNNYLYIVGGWSNGYLDSVYVSNLAISTPTPTALPTETATPLPTTPPTITPTTTPTATPTLPVLSVPSLKQYSIPWKNEIYDSTKATIEEFGCALTSAVMVLQYHGHTILPDALNTWLKNQSDGYIRNGLINWLAVSRYTKLHDSLTSPTLEYKRLDANNNNLDNELNLSRPAILKEDGHFVVATGKTDTTYLINDPGYSDRNTLESYGNSFLAINSYTPTHSDLSYIMGVVQGDKTIILLDTDNNEIAHSYIETPIKDLYSDNLSPSTSYSVLYFQKPETGKYKLKVNGQGRYNLDLYYYYKDGDFKKNNLIGNLKKNQTNNYEITYFKNGDIENLFNKLINQTKGNKIANTYLKTAYKLYNRNLNKPALVLLNNLKRATYRGSFSDIREDLSALISLLLNK